ncbi:MAG: DNA-binding response regulator [Acidobacteria bacterium RIFCSPLOWO2_02_FULL_68_18]|nr:MAG: DNA-binding response regulator [Acidobacteria bacterium RIFCSPLOWO2_02_FULL_68_18]OFW48868.1 MAG: DNA-binding response regulator [Acidobacteria bacterium RIFCSPLOWO2_12_FULL_68_19]
MRILLVEDDRDISHFLMKGLREERHVVDLVEDGLAAEERAYSQEYDVIVLDIMLPGLNGLDVCRRLRKLGVDTPILILTAREDTQDRVSGLDAGADDYLTKPFSFDELLARLRAIVRRGRTKTLSAVLKYGPIELDVHDHTVRVSGHRIDLTATEYRLLEHLLHRPETVVSREQLADRVWGRDLDPASNVVEVYVGYLRKKMQAHYDEPLVHTVRGLGYMLKT